ncbi:MAG TPA: SRPBCC family protein [Actinoplanes sp.]|nr:SRPBCC family protein [Actinoplanes sp.]
MVEKKRIRRANLILTGLIGVFGAVFLWLTIRSGRADSALLFVVLPTVVAGALALTPGATTHGRVFRLTTIGLLLAAVALHEGAVCVVLAAPLVYGVAHAVTAVAGSVRESRRLPALIPLPLLLLGVEGTDPQWRINPDQTVEVTRVITADPATVPALLTAGPQPAGPRSVPLRLLGVPTPEHVHGAGLAAGDRWTFGYHGSSHGPGGQIVTEVTGAAPGELEFRVVEDSSITGRWVDLRDATLSWRAVPGGTEVTVRIDYRRGLDPSWYFGPLQDGLMHAGAGHLLDMLDLQ